MEIEQSVWSITPEGEAVILYTMRNASGASVQLTNIGAAVVSVTVPDGAGVMADVALGYLHYNDYFGDATAMGKTVGRTTGRVRNARITIDGADNQLVRNTPPHHSDGGGLDGWHNRLWQSRVETDRVVFSFVSTDGDQGYPGEVCTEVVYDWDDDNVLEITMYAKSSAPTVINMTNRVYFNLAGEGTVLNHELTINSDSFLATDAAQIVTGELVSAGGTPMDFRAAKRIGKDIDADYEPLKTTLGYDHCWAVNDWRKDHISQVAELHDPASGRMVAVSSTQPAFHVYTGNLLQGGPQGKRGQAYADRDGVMLACQGFPNAPNVPAFPSQRLDPDDIYEEHAIYRFGVRA